MPLLETITIASPCTADWDAMRGDERVRFCGQCELNVYNLSAMPRDEAQELVRETEGKICVRMFKRRDGTVITQDCPVGLRAKLRRKLSWIAGLAASLLASVGGVFLGARGESERTGSKRGRPLPVFEVQGAPLPPSQPPRQVVECELPAPPPQVLETTPQRPSVDPEEYEEVMGGDVAYDDDELLEIKGEAVCEPPLDEELSPTSQTSPR